MTDRRERLRAGLRAGIPFALASTLLSLSFGVLATEAGFPWWGAVLMSAIVFAGSAQFGALSIVAAGGTAGAAIGAAALMNARFLPMGVAFAPSLPGGPVKRALQGQAVVDTSWAMAMREDGSFDRWFLFGHSGVQYVGWTTGTLLGALAGSSIGDPRTLGLDALFPAFFLAILLGELRSRRAAGVALAGAAIALVLVPLTPAGVPVLLAGLAALWGLRA